MIIMDSANLTDQAGMERALRQYFDDEQMKNGETLNSMLGARLHKCDFEKRTLVVSVDIKSWMANPGGTLHGGIIATGFDFVMGLLCRYYSDGRLTPTIDLNVNYLSPAYVNDTLCFKGELTHKGSSVCSTTGKMWVNGQEDRILATASGAFYVLKVGKS